MVSVRTPERDIYLTQVLEEVRLRLAELRITAEVTGRPKHLYSIYEKMVRACEFDDIFDLVGMRVVVESVKDCYAALGSIHATWKPVQGRFKDYIAMPKFNLYQSLHTTVIGPQGKPLEVQIRTWEMHAKPSRAWPPTGPTRTALPTPATCPGSTGSWTGSPRPATRTSSCSGSRSTSSRTRSSCSPPRAS